MHLTKFSHSCVRLDDGDRAVVIDPGSFSEVEDAVRGAAAILITHEHPDHVDTRKVRAALRADPRLQVFAPAGVAASFAEFGEQVISVAVGQEFQAGGFTVQPVGGQHALIHPSIPVVPNLGYLIAGVYHPGDSLIVPTEPVRTLLAPVHAPWSKTAEVIDFVVSVRAPSVHQIHDGLLNPTGLGFVEAHVSRIGAEHGCAYQHLDVRATVSV